MAAAGHEPDDVPVGEGGQQDRADRGGQEIAGRDHDAEDAAEDAALADVEPGAVDLDHGQRAEALEVHVQAPQPAHGPEDVGRPAVEEHQADAQVERGRPPASRSGWPCARRCGRPAGR